MSMRKKKVERCSRYGNGDRMHVILNGEPLEEVDCFKYLGSQVAADGGCERDVVHRMNEGETKGCVYRIGIVEQFIHCSEIAVTQLGSSPNFSLGSAEKCPEQ